RNTNFTASGRVDYSDVAVLQVEEKQLVSRRLLPRDIIIERSGGGPSQPVGRVVFFDRDDGVFSHSNFTSRLRVLDTDRFEPLFVFFFLLYFHDSGQTDDLQRRTTGIRNLDWRAYREVACIPLFDLNEQWQIAAFLSAMQRAIERQERLISLTAELKKALMCKLFTEGTRSEPLKETEFGLIPQSWKVERIGAVCRSIVPGRNKPRIFDGDIPWLTTPEIKRLTYIRDSLPSRRVSRKHLDEIGGRIVPANSVIMTCVGEFGIVAINLLPLVINQQLHAFVCPDYLNPYFLCQMLRTRSTYMTQIAHKTTVPYLNKSKCESVPIVIPSVEEQNEIATLLQRADARVDVARRQKQCFEGLFRTLLHQLMTSQIRVDDLDLSALEEPELEPAGAA
ncbi:MAG: restriction endonuclease subunit S, partial [Acidobacteriota bacterium]